MRLPTEEEYEYGRKNKLSRKLIDRRIMYQKMDVLKAIELPPPRKLNLSEHVSYGTYEKRMSNGWPERQAKILPGQSIIAADLMVKMEDEIKTLRRENKQLKREGMRA